MLPRVRITLSGHDGADARRYHVDDVLEALALLREAQEGQP